MALVFAYCNIQLIALTLVEIQRSVKLPGTFYILNLILSMEISNWSHYGIRVPQF